MLRCLCLSVVLFALPLSAQQPKEAKDIPELKPLAGYLGKWTAESTVKSEGQIPIMLKGTSSAEWFHEGRFLRQSWAIEGTKEHPTLTGSTMMTYDLEKKTYRAWNFMSNGASSEAEGAYDAKANAFTWTVQRPDGVKTVTKASFADEGKEKWSIVTTDKAGKVLMDMRGLSTKAKE
jgi:hypothetical protein